MLQFKHHGTAPDIDDVCRMFDLEQREINKKFGVIATDSKKGLYTVLVDVRSCERITAKLAGRPSDPAEGIFSNPPVANNDGA